MTHLQLTHLTSSPSIVYLDSETLFCHWIKTVFLSQSLFFLLNHSFGFTFKALQLITFFTFYMLFHATGVSSYTIPHTIINVINILPFCPVFLLANNRSHIGRPSVYVYINPLSLVVHVSLILYTVKYEIRLACLLAANIRFLITTVCTDWSCKCAILIIFLPPILGARLRVT